MSVRRSRIAIVTSPADFNSLPAPAIYPAAAGTLLARRANATLGPYPDDDHATILTSKAESSYRDEHTLLAELRQGSRDAYRYAVTHYSGPMLATARAIAGAANAEDIVQDAWLTVFRQLDGFEGRSSLATWLQRIVMNRAISVWRKAGREINSGSSMEPDVTADWYNAKGGWASPPLAWHTSSPDELLTADELQACLDKHLECMPEQQRVVLVLRDIQGLPFDDICTMLELSATNARVLVHRGRLRLMAMVNHFEETGTC